MKIRGLLNLASCFLLLAGIGCGNSVTGSDAGGSNTQLSAVHEGGPDCSQSGCHPGFGAAGTVFDGATGSAPARGKSISIKSVGTGSEITLASDSLGNFHYEGALNGYYTMSIDGKPWSQPHNLPDWKGCNSCHKWPPSNGAPGRLFAD